MSAARLLFFLSRRRLSHNPSGTTTARVLGLTHFDSDMALELSRQTNGRAKLTVRQSTCHMTESTALSVTLTIHPQATPTADHSFRRKLAESALISTALATLYYVLFAAP